MTGTSHTASQEWRANWTLVLSAAAGFSFMSIMTTAMGAFIGPLVKEFGWSRTVVSMGLPIAGVLSVLLSPVVGLFIDRYGSRRLAIPGLVGMIVCTAAFGLISGSVTQWVVLWAVYALVSLAVTVSVWTAAVARAFTAGRGLALGLTLAGTAVAQAVAPVLATWLIGAFGWRTAFVAIAFGWGGFALLLCLLFFRAPSDGPAQAAARDTSAEPGLTIPQAWRDPGLWRIAISTFVLMVLTIGLLIHQIPILVEAGVTPERAALLAGAGGLAGILGKLVTGVLVDRFRANWVGGVTLGFTAFAFLLLLDGVRTPALIVAAMLINGYSAGTKLQICSYLTSRYGGLRNFGTIFGFIGSLTALGSALGPLLAGMVYDRTGGYEPFLIAGTIGCVFCGLLIVSLPRYPDWNEGPVRDDESPAADPNMRGLA
ncbi:MFS transporter [Novosphingobium sp. JCM 18896]|uniref:MFS transporter n=1 Tax=Novosphingobium sp. JCM 18896 TaxID=2989731 RepID=UPI002223691B|nr:MFS transporter [Novosphingobium sp. JCM 18896]MCW1427646.1 MFS transporter [Novosphingobium sp. JCM 18896]